MHLGQLHASGSQLVCLGTANVVSQNHAVNVILRFQQPLAGRCFRVQRPRIDQHDIVMFCQLPQRRSHAKRGGQFVMAQASAQRQNRQAIGCRFKRQRVRGTAGRCGRGVITDASAPPGGEGWRRRGGVHRPWTRPPSRARRASGHRADRRQRPIPQGGRAASRVRKLRHEVRESP